MSDDINKRNIPKIVRENQLDFLYKLYSEGVQIGSDNIEKLRAGGLLNDVLSKEPRRQVVTDHINKTVLNSNTALSKKADALIDIIEESGTKKTSFDVLTSTELEERRKSHGHVFEGREKPILRHELLPESTTDHKQDFVDWINSINTYGFVNRVNYRLFNLYCQQAYAWLQENKTSADFDDEDDREDFRQEELRRCDDNALYFLNKYVWYKEGDAEDQSGRIKYIAAPVHEFLAYMDDCGYSMGIAKGRQMAATTTIMSLNMRKVVFRQNYFTKFITEDDEKAIEIFEDKLKYAFGELPNWMRPDVLNERDNLFKTGKKEEQKGKKGGVGASIRLTVPKRTAIAGGSPQEVMIDETGNIKILGVMIGNARPTMLWYNPKTKKIEMKRRLVYWGCVCAGTKVWTNNGTLLNIEDLKQNQGILGYNGESVSKEPINWMKSPAKKPCYRITTTGGDTIECSNDHPLLWGKTGWKTSYNRKYVTFKKAQDVKIGDHLMMIGSVSVFGKQRIDYARLLGLMIGDGNYSLNSTPQMSVSEKEIGDYLKNNFNKETLSTKVYKTKIQKNGTEFTSVGMKGFVKFLQKHKMHGQSKNLKRLPFDINSFDKKSVAELIGGYFDADGNVNYNKSKKIIRIVLTSTIPELLREVKSQLIKFGIGCTIAKENRNQGKKISGGQKDHIYRLYINNQGDVLKFRKEIKLLCKHKQKVLDGILNIKSNWKSYGNVRAAEFVMGENGKGKHFLGNKNMINLKYKVIKNIEFIGEKEVYNLTAGTTHTYIANGFITANTGGEMEKGGKAFETEFMSLLRQWEENNFSSGIVPIFFDWRCRPGATQEDYDREKYVAYKKAENNQDPEAKKHITEFHQTWPNSLSDVFRASAKTLVDEEYIEAAITRINAAKKEHNFTLHQSGYFEPVFDLTKPMPEGSIVPYKIIGSEFIPTSDIDRRASTCIFMQPDHQWKKRYYSGIDPIDTNSGLSDFSNTIWDKYFKTCAAILSFRVPDYPQVFLQSLLLNLYYDPNEVKVGIKELIESNRGTSYYQFLVSMGYGNNCVLNYQLPLHLQNSSTINEGVGIDNKGARNNMLINYMFQLYSYYGKNVFHVIVFEQMKTFTCVISDGGKEMWGPINKKYFKDDTLWSSTFAYICGELCFPELVPTDTEKAKSKTKIVFKLVRGKDNKLKSTPVKVQA